MKVTLQTRLSERSLQSRFQMKSFATWQLRADLQFGLKHIVSTLSWFFCLW
jgi:hypothetical protein